MFLKIEPRTGSLKTIYLGLSTIAFAVISVLLATELLLRLFLQESYHWDHRLMFFSEGKVFQNKDWGGFVYYPNSAIRSQTFYIVNDNTGETLKEYDYIIKTNSLGLVQMKDPERFKPAIIFLGDSFTEGQGSSPWFYELEKRWPTTASHQIINGGILGTGFEAWGHLYRDVSASLKVEKVVFIFISDDWRRSVWQFPKNVLGCLISHTDCTGREGFYGLPQDPILAEAHVANITRAHIDHLSKPVLEKNFLKRAYIFRKLIRPAYNRLRQYPEEENKTSADQAQFAISQKTVRDLVSEVGKENVLFFHLPTKWELDTGPVVLGQKARDFLSRDGLRLVDGFEICGLTPNDYHIDGHPNDGGYGKIVDCVEGTVRAAFHPL